MVMLLKPGEPEPAPPDSGAPAREGSPAGEGAAAAVHSPPGPDWPTARTRLDVRRPDGVVTLDPLAVRALPAATGPVGVPGHGRLDAAGAAPRLTGDTDHGYARAVLEATAGRLLGGRDLLTAGRALAEAGAGGHLRAYAADPALERLLARHRLAGDQGG